MNTSKFKEKLVDTKTFPSVDKSPRLFIKSAKKRSDNSTIDSTWQTPSSPGQLRPTIVIISLSHQCYRQYTGTYIYLT